MWGAEKGWKAASIQYYVDFCGLEDRKITIRGWILDLTGENNLSITDENGNVRCRCPESFPSA